MNAPVPFGGLGRSMPPTRDAWAERAWYNVKDFVPPWTTIGDGVVRKLSNYFSTLAEAQEVYPGVPSLHQTIDTAAINEAQRVCAEAGGGIVYIPEGDYRANIYFDEDNVDLYGSSGAKIRPLTGTALSIQNISDFHGGTVFGLKISGAGGDGAITGISVEASSHVCVQNVDINDVYKGIFINGDNSKEITFNDVIITDPEEVGFEYKHQYDRDLGGVYIWNMRIAGYTDVGGIRTTSRGMHIWSEHAPDTEDPETHRMQAQTATGMVFAVNLVLDGRYDRALEIKNIDGCHFQMLYISGTLSDKGLVHLVNAKDTQINQAWIQNSAPNSGQGQPLPGHCFEFENVDGRQCADLQFSQLRLSCLGYDFFYKGDAAPIRSRISDVASTSAYLSVVSPPPPASGGVTYTGAITNNRAVHRTLHNPQPKWLGGSSAPVSKTGTLARVELGKCSIPGREMGPTGHIEVKLFFRATDNANNKQLLVLLGSTAGVGGTKYLDYAFSGARTYQTTIVIRNREAVNSQFGGADNGVVSGPGPAIVTSSINTNSAVELFVGAELAVGTDEIELLWWQAVMHPGP